MEINLLEIEDLPEWEQCCCLSKLQRLILFFLINIFTFGGAIYLIIAKQAVVEPLTVAICSFIFVIIQVRKKKLFVFFKFRARKLGWEKKKKWIKNKGTTTTTEPQFVPPLIFLLQILRNFSFFEENFRILLLFMKIFFFL
jgi:hypothetical protein